jgi:hypothetical protein
MRKPLADDSSSLLQTGSLGGRQGNVLLIRHPEVSWPDCDCVTRGPQSFDRSLHLVLGAGQERESRLVCSSAELPFQEYTFKRVVLWHVISAGDEPELSEACRVLVPGGELLVLGINPLGLRARLDREAKNLPQLHSRQLQARLRELNMEVDAVLGAGFIGLTNRTMRHGQLSGLLLPLVDLVLVRAQPAESPPMNALRLEQFQAGVAPTA